LYSRIEFELFKYQKYIKKTKKKQTIS